MTICQPEHDPFAFTMDSLHKVPNSVIWRWRTKSIWHKLTLQFPLLLVLIQHPQLHQKHRNQYKHLKNFFLCRKQFMLQNQAERTNSALYILTVYIGVIQH